MEKTMRVWVLQIRESGGEDMVFLFDSLEKAEKSAYRQLLELAESQVEDDVEELPDTLDELGEIVENNDWGYYSIYISDVE